MTPGFALPVAYLIGSFPTSYLAGKLARGIDLREHGSRNLGATNVFRTLGWKYAVPVGMIDVAKGAVPVLVFGKSAGAPPWLGVAVGMATVLGHMFSPFLRFRGGKGVATAGGVFIALAPLAIVLSALVWGLVLWLSGYVSVASLVASLLFPVFAWLTNPGATYTILAGIALALLIVFSHRANIGRLRTGAEHRFRTRKGRDGSVTA
ncbi:MAG TPA: glycerol-3-phosphate 1-O-acyltransferase PlsY [Gemmatimonadales bacterium]|nr:glycerol-3-phosphate 1-O-acyltransferase PlsY [Gemmatimonadales bacterium]